MAGNNETFSQESYNHGGLITFLISMGVSILFFIVLLLFHPGVDLKEVGGEEGKKAEPTANSPATGEQAPAAADQQAK